MVRHLPSWLTELRFEPFELPAERWTLPASNAENLNIWMVRISEEFLRRMELAKRTNGCPAVSPKQWLKPILYQIILSYAHEGLLHELEARITDNGRYSRRNPTDAKFFLRGIMALSAHDQNLLTQNDRSRMAREMWHGFRNYIPPDLLNGFNRQYASAKRVSDDSQDTIVPELHPWISRERVTWSDLSRDLEELRGRYPNDVESSMEEILDETLTRQRKIRQQIKDADWDE